MSKFTDDQLTYHFLTFMVMYSELFVLLRSLRDVIVKKVDLDPETAQKLESLAMDPQDIQQAFNAMQHKFQHVYQNIVNQNQTPKTQTLDLGQKNINEPAPKLSDEDSSKGEFLEL